MITAFNLKRGGKSSSSSIDLEKKTKHSAFSILGQTHPSPTPPPNFAILSFTVTMSFDASASLSVSDPNARALSSSCFDFLLIELVPMAERLAKELSTDENEPEEEEVRETTYFRLESLGYRVGQGLAER